MNVGDNITFGSYVWRVLEVKEDKLLLLSEYIIEKRPYHNKYTEVTWETCELRNYLNDTFYHSFTKEEQSKIIPVNNMNKDNKWYLTDAGNDTFDHIFLLDVDDVVCKYFGDSSKILNNKREKQRYWFGTNDKNNLKRLTTYKGMNYWWWLRTPGRNQKTAVYIHGNPAGAVGINGNSVLFTSYTQERHGGIRPALWIKK